MALLYERAARLTVETGNLRSGQPCHDGPPSACSSSCAKVLPPFMRKCGTVEALGDAFVELAPLNHKCELVARPGGGH
jgi:hypothetical protein